MTSILSDDAGKIFAYCEWWITNGNDKFGGDYLYVRDLWVHPSYRGINAIESLIQKIDEHPFSKEATWVYWNRGEHKNKKGQLIKSRVSKAYKKSTAIKRGKLLWVDLSNHLQNK